MLDLGHVVEHIPGVPDLPSLHVKCIGHVPLDVGHHVVCQGTDTC